MGIIWGLGVGYFRLTANRRDALLTTALLLSLAAPAEAQVFWPSERSDAVRVERKRVVHRARQSAPKVEAVKDTTKPVGPVIINISIEKQQLKIYDDNGVFAESPVSTGMPGHPTPMGVFSVIGKEVFHRSNIYSGAPMPHMQRITWSGVAMHEGVLPGRPASHGCIRLPGAFATRMFGWTKMGARVIITPGEMPPSEFSHRLLVTQKPERADPNLPIASGRPSDVTTTPKGDKAELGAPDLRLTTTGSGDGPKKSDEVRTADASGTVVAKPDTGSDAKPEIRTEPKSDQKPDQKTDKDQARPQDGGKAAATPAPRPMPGSAEFIGPIKPNTGQVAAFISRKEGKLFVRQAFKPIFTVPVTIAPGEKPLGTHVFTVKSDDNGKLQWIAVSLPAPTRATKLAEAQYSRRKKPAPEPAAPLPPSTASEALDLITVPDDAMTRLASLLAPGGSLVVSDQGLGDETGDGTDFIVHLR
ncbi:MAG: L,D-transpeptidase [Afipia sp.]|nr:L,D-transpeptidase [Afipia sp.]